MQNALLGSGKCSSFGGRLDDGVGPQEGLGCIEPADLNDWWFCRLFLESVNKNNYDTSYGLARNLNPKALYCAMRWGYALFEGKHGEILPHLTREQIRRAIFMVESDHGFCFVQAADFGPNPDTGRLIDLSPGALELLQVGTDDIVTVTAIW